MSTRLFSMKAERAEELKAAEDILTRAEGEKRPLTASEQGVIDAHLERVKVLTPKIAEVEKVNTIFQAFGNNPAALLDVGKARPTEGTDRSGILTAEEGRFMAAQFRAEFGVWMNNVLRAVGGGDVPKMEASSPSGALSIGSGSGLDSIGVTVPVEILPYMPSYFNLDSFALAGASQIFTDHTRPLVKPILSAGAADSVYAEGAAPSTSQPFGLSSFTFNGTKYARLVLATYEALMNSELPLNGVIFDELLASLATTFTAAVTTAMYAALSAASSSLEVGAGGSGGSIYTSMIDLRHAIPPRFDLPTNKWMLSRATLATIKNTRASTSGVPMFDPNSNLIFGREFVVNDNFDAAAAGLVVYGSWENGCWLRKTPVFTRVFLERFSGTGELGFQTTQWLDSHFLAELVAAPQPPTFQPLYYTNISSES